MGQSKNYCPGKPAAFDQVPQGQKHSYLANGNDQGYHPPPIYGTIYFASLSNQAVNNSKCQKKETVGDEGYFAVIE